MPVEMVCVRPPGLPMISTGSPSMTSSLRPSAMGVSGWSVWAFRIAISSAGLVATTVQGKCVPSESTTTCSPCAAATCSLVSTNPFSWIIEPLPTDCMKLPG